MRKFLALLLISVSFLLTACGLPQKEAQQEDKTLYTVTDATGTQLSFSQKPQRIASLNVSTDEILLDLVDDKRLIALSTLADDGSICSAGDKVKAVPNRSASSNLESVLAVRPDLVIVPDYSMEPVRALRSTGLKVYVCHTPNSMAEIYSLIRNLGEAVGDKEKGEAMAFKLQHDLEAVREQSLKAAGEKQLEVLALSFTGPLGMKGTFSDLCHYAGVKNALEGVDIPYQSNLSEEKMLELNPDMIITPSWDYSKKGDPEEFRQKILQNPVYKNVNAVKNNRVVRLHDQYLYSTSQYTLKAVEELAQAAYK